MDEFSLLTLLAVLASAWIGGLISKRLGYPAILGELIIGIILGPALLGWLAPSGMIDILSEVGIILLMVHIGMEINFKDLGKASWPGLLAAIGGFIVPFILGYYTILHFGGTQMSAIFVAIAVAVTSLATKSRILVDLKLLNTRIAYVLMAGALISDTLALIIFAGIITYIDVGDIDTLGLLWVASKAILFFIVTTLIGIYLLPLLGKYLRKANIKNRTLHFTLILILTFGFSELAEIAGLHSILGAFMAGLFIRDGIFDRQVSKEVNNIFHDVSIGFLAPIFFVSSGFHVTLDVFKTDLSLFISVIVVAIVGKIVGTALFYLPSGHGWREGITVGTGMNGRGAVEIIIAGIGLKMGIISNEIFSILVFMAIFTTLTVPVLLTWTTNWLRKRGELVEQDTRKGYLILGANPLGLYIAEILNQENEVTIIDANKEMLAQAQQKGLKTIHGNILEEETLEDANATEKQTFIALTGNSEINLLAAQLANDTFYIPQKIILFSPKKNSVNAKMLDKVDTFTMFANKTKLQPWVNKIDNKNFKEETLDTTQKITAENWVESHQKSNKNVLPLFIVNKEGKKRLFHNKESIMPKEKVIYLT